MSPLTYFLALVLPGRVAVSLIGIVLKIVDHLNPLKDSAHRLRDRLAPAAPVLDPPFHTSGDMR